MEDLISGSYGDVWFVSPQFSDYWAQQSGEPGLYPGSVIDRLCDLEHAGLKFHVCKMGVTI